MAEKHYFCLVKLLNSLGHSFLAHAQLLSTEFLGIKSPQDGGKVQLSANFHSSTYFNIVPSNQDATKKTNKQLLNHLGRGLYIIKKKRKLCDSFLFSHFFVLFDFHSDLPVVKYGCLVRHSAKHKIVRQTSRCDHTIRRRSGEKKIKERKKSRPHHHHPLSVPRCLRFALRRRNGEAMG